MPRPNRQPDAQPLCPPRRRPHSLPPATDLPLLHGLSICECLQTCFGAQHIVSRRPSHALQELGSSLRALEGPQGRADARAHPLFPPEPLAGSSCPSLAAWDGRVRAAGACVCRSGELSLCRDVAPSSVSPNRLVLEVHLVRQTRPPRLSGSLFAGDASFRPEQP